MFLFAELSFETPDVDPVIYGDLPSNVSIQKLAAFLFGLRCSNINISLNVV